MIIVTGTSLCTVDAGISRLVALSEFVVFVTVAVVTGFFELLLVSIFAGVVDKLPDLFKGKLIGTPL